MRPGWNEYFMVVAKIISTRSTCNSRPTGAVIVRDKQILSTGYNGSMPGAPHCSDDITEDGKPFCLRRSMKVPEGDKYNFCRSSHAEANAIARAARFGISLDNSTLFVTLSPCYVCLKQLANAGVKRIYYEYDYESTNKKRDEHWRMAVNESPIESIKKLRVSDENLMIIMKSLQYPTSKRRLSENNENITPQDNIDMNNPKLDKVYKKALLDALTGEFHNEQMLGESLNLETFADFSIQNKRRKTALNLLSSIEIIEDNNLGKSDVISEILSEIISAKKNSITISKKPFSINAILEDGKLNMVFKLKEMDILDFFITIDSASLIYIEIFENLVDHVDISIERGTMEIAVDRPYISKSKVEEIKRILVK